MKTARCIGITPKYRDWKAKRLVGWPNDENFYRLVRASWYRLSEPVECIAEGTKQILLSTDISVTKWKVKGKDLFYTQVFGLNTLGNMMDTDSIYNTRDDIAIPEILQRLGYSLIVEDTPHATPAQTTVSIKKNYEAFNAEKINPEEKTTTLKCSHCGSIGFPSNITCTQCGALLEYEDTQEDKPRDNRNGIAAEIENDSEVKSFIEHGIARIIKNAMPILLDELLQRIKKD